VKKLVHQFLISSLRTSLVIASHHHILRNLGVTFDSDFNFRKHVSLTCRFCFYHIRDLRHILRYISLSVAKTIATALIDSRLDYCNSLLDNITSKCNVVNPQQSTINYIEDLMLVIRMVIMSVYHSP